MSSVLDKYRPDPLSDDNIRLPHDWLALEQVAGLFAPKDLSERNQYKQALIAAVIDGELRVRASEKSPFELLPYHGHEHSMPPEERRLGLAASLFFDNGGEAEICRADLKAWLKDKGLETLPPDLPLYKWLLLKGQNSSSGKPSKVSKPRPPSIHKIRVRAVAQEKWKTDPDMTIVDIAYSNEVTRACDEHVYSEDTIRNWIKDLAPNRNPGRRPKD